MEQTVDRHRLAVAVPLPSLDQLLSILEGMPSLEVLILGYCLPRPDSLSRVVPLPHMTRLSLEGSLSECVAILEHVSLPGSASLSLSGSAQGSPDGLLSTLISLTAAHFRAARTPMLPLSTLRVCDDFMLTAWDGWGIDLSSDLPVFAPSAPLQLYLYFFGIEDDELLHSLPLQVYRSFPLRDLRTVSMTRGGLIDWTPAEWADVSDHCPKVAHLQADIDWVPVLECALMERAFFPNLVTLSLVGIDLESLGHPSDGQSQPLSVLLCTWLRARRDAGIPLRRVEILDCDIKHKSLESLRALVQDVEWDGNGPVYDDSDSYIGPSILW
ncbi:hypothetical protein BJV78DRAFT_1364731 [Lactifluus subvellereus]|nr:hypothetical protein BJV78DRAFT_1364731 [Lactifluus subvellereus]